MLHAEQITTSGSFEMPRTPSALGRGVDALREQVQELVDRQLKKSDRGSELLLR